MTLPRLRVCAGLLGRAAEPVDLGQTRGGIVVAALLLVVWQVNTVAWSDVVNPGFSENDYFRLEWDYDLAAGAGTFILTPDDDPDILGIWLETAHFSTWGIPFDSITIDGQPAPFGFEHLGDDRYAYSLQSDMYFEDPLAVDVTFPVTKIRLLSTQFDYDGMVSSVAGPFVMWPSSMNFVSIQQIPQPAAVSLLGVGAAAAAAFMRRGRDGDRHGL